MVAAVEGGADIVEIGVPYSDPGMDGPVIQQAVDVAVRAGVGMRDVLRAVEAVAAAGAVPVVMSYWNPIERYGVERFATDLAAAGGAGAITPDLIPDEAAAWIAAAEAADLDRVFLVAPSSTDARLRLDDRRLPRFRLRRLDDGRDRHAGHGRRRRGDAGRPHPGGGARPRGVRRPRRLRRTAGGRGGIVRRRRHRRVGLRAGAARAAGDRRESGRLSEDLARGRARR